MNEVRRRIGKESATITLTPTRATQPGNAGTSTRNPQREDTWSNSGDHGHSRSQTDIRGDRGSMNTNDGQHKGFAGGCVSEVGNDKVTKIHGKYYDLTSFEAIHPGGKTAMWLAFKRDATVLFESHHRMSSRKKADALLAKYEITKPANIDAVWLDPPQGVPQFKFDTPFANDLRVGVEQYFQKLATAQNVSLITATKATQARWVQIFLLYMVRFVLVYYWLCGSWTAMILLPIAEWVSSGNVWHDASHFALSTRPFVNDLFTYTIIDFTSPFQWYLQHGIFHHCYTNIEGLDPDLYHGKHFVRKTFDVPYRFYYVYQYISVYPLEWTSVVLATAVIYHIEFFFIGAYFQNWRANTSDKFRLFLLAFDRLVFGLVYIVFPFWYFGGLSSGNVLFVFFPRMIWGLCFMVNTQLTHLTESSVLGDMEDRNPEHDWYKHQVQTSGDFAVRSWWIYLFSAGLNFQTVHHLFPNVNHCHHTVLQPIVERICQKHGVEYKVYAGYQDILRYYHRFILYMGFPKIE